MTVTVSGPMFEPATSTFWKSVHGKEGAHYNNYGCTDEDGMAALRALFPKGEADEFNIVLFSTSGVHGHYGTIEDAENPEVEEGEEPYDHSVTFLVVQPRIACLRHGNCVPRTPEDFAFLRSLRESSWRVVQTIGAVGASE